MMEVCVCVCAHGTMFASGGSRAIHITISLFDPGAVKVGQDLHGFGLTEIKQFFQFKTSMS